MRRATTAPTPETTSNGARSTRIVIPEPKLETMTIAIVGTSPYVGCKFPEKARRMIAETQAAGSQSKSRKKREAKDFDAIFKEAIHFSEEGWPGIPAPAFRNAMISACRLIGFKMTIAKMSVFAEPDGFDADDGTPLVKIIGPAPERHEGVGRNTSGVVDIRVRPMWRKWGANVRIKFDVDQFSATDVANLMLRAGMQVGIGEGRHDSRNSNGLGWGCFAIKNS